MSILETRDLNKHFGGLHVTANVNFALDEGELHCLIGPNGAGKSTFFRLILGEHAPSSGSIIYAGEDITALKSFQRIRRGMSVKFQVPGIFKALSARQNLEIALQHHLESASLAAEVDRLLAFLNLLDVAAQLAGNLSHGQKQWLEIGMAISLKPKLLAAGRADRRHVAGGNPCHRRDRQDAECRRRHRARGRARYELRAAGRAPGHRAASRQDLRAGHHRRDRCRRARRRNLSGAWPCVRSKEVLLSTLKLRSGYGGKPVLQGIDMDVREGEIVAVIGRNGVGKSTLMKTLIGLLPPTEGNVVFKGEDVSAMVAHRRARLGIGYVPQGRDVFPRMSVEENLKVGEMIGGRVSAERLCAGLCDLSHSCRAARQQAGTMSGGQQQQLAIGRVMIAIRR